MLSSLLAILFRLTGLKPMWLPGVAGSWKGSVLLESMSHCPTIMRADASPAGACRMQLRTAQ